MTFIIKETAKGCDRMTEKVNPKDCFGDYMGKTCQGHNRCEWQGKCFRETSQNKGVCDCPFKGSCHLPRQRLTETFRQEDASYVCSFVAMFEEDKKKKEGKR